MNYLIVGLGGALGSIIRYAINQWLAPKNLLFPYATFLANILSCLLLGFVLALFSKNTIDERQRLFFITGVCGGFSTFSTFTNETFQLFQSGNFILALANIVFNMLVCIICLILGFKLIDLF
jgi:fluoride exporter